MGRCELEWKGPGAVGDHSPAEDCSSCCSLVGSAMEFRAGEDGLDGYGEPDGNGDCAIGDSVKR